MMNRFNPFPLRAGRPVVPAAVVLCASLLAYGCSSGPQVRADYDRTADFSQYRTYGFVAAAGTDQSGFRSLSTQALQAAAAKEMEARGYTRSDNSDLVIDFNGRLEEKTDIQSTPTTATMRPLRYGYRGWYGAPYGAYGNEVTTRRYKVGTLVMDVVDSKKQQAVFQGGIEGVVTKEMLADRPAALTAALAKIFERYPFVAGQSAPVTATDEQKN